jgi:hypothetical protein
VRIITDQGRDYYFSVSGALKELVSALQALQRPGEAEECEHLKRRAFFFFGMFIYKEHEFAFSHGYIYLGHLWAEAAVRRLVNEIVGVIQLTPVDEAVVHKCFSDRWHFRNDAAAGITFKVRSLYDLEQVLLGEATVPREAGDRLREVYSRVSPQFTRPTVLERLECRVRAVRSIVEYEFTKLFEDWYAGEKGARVIPKKAPTDFENIVGPGSWRSIRQLLPE